MRKHPDLTAAAALQAVEAAVCALTAPVLRTAKVRAGVRCSRAGQSQRNRCTGCNGRASLPFVVVVVVVVVVAVVAAVGVVGGVVLVLVYPACIKNCFVLWLRPMSMNVCASVVVVQTSSSASTHQGSALSPQVPCLPMHGALSGLFFTRLCVTNHRRAPDQESNEQTLQRYAQHVCPSHQCHSGKFIIVWLCEFVPLCSSGCSIDILPYTTGASSRRCVSAR